MKLDKKHWMMLVAGVVVLFLVYWFLFRKKKNTTSSYNPAIPLIGGNESGYSASDIGGLESGYNTNPYNNPLIKVNRPTPDPLSKISPCRAVNGVIKYPCTYGGIRVNDQRELQLL
jgi:LPXTG-motif cell wall-anchored protein